jgi:hypothetical protein
MGIKLYIDKIVEYIDSNSKKIFTITISVFAILVLSIVLFIGIGNMSVSKEVGALINYIEQRKYSQAISYYEKTKEDLGPKEEKRFEDNVGKKINKILLEYGSKYIDGEIGKEYLIGFINTIDKMRTIQLDGESILKQSEEVKNMYVSDKVDYKTANGYINAVSNLNIAKYEIESYATTINTYEESRVVYKDAMQKQEKKMYKEAIESYKKVIKEDTKYYELAQKKTNECIDTMYDYYITKAEEYNKEGNYTGALETINYLQKHYIDDEKIYKLHQKYSKNVDKYNMNNTEILNLIVKKIKINREKLDVGIYQDMIGAKKYYYVEASLQNKIINKFLIDAKTKKLYGYLDVDITYNGNGCDGYWRKNEKGVIEFAINKGEAVNLIRNKAKEFDKKLRNIEYIGKQKAVRYLGKDYEENLKKLYKGKYDINYYIVGKSGFFSKYVFIVDPYENKVYYCGENGITNIK